MATFSTSQVRQLYVAKELKTPKVAATDAAGAIAVKADTAHTHLYFEHVGKGGITRSDLIDTKNIAYVKATDADSMATPLGKVEITAKEDPIAGQDYILKVYFRNFIGLSDEYQMTKLADTRATSSMEKSDLYVELAKSLVTNTKDEVSKLFTVYLKSASATTEVTYMNDTDFYDLYDGTYTALVLEEVEQEWKLGTFKQIPLHFDVLPGTVISDGDEVIWGTVTPVAATAKVENGKTIADLEYFCMGARGDIYRQVGFPYNVTTEYLVDPTVKYNVIDIHYAFQGAGENIQKSEKDITLVIPKVGDTNAIANDLTNDIIDAIETATGLTIAGLATT